MALTLDRPMHSHKFALAAAALLAVAAASAPARAGDVVDMRYNVEIAGTRIMDIDYRLDLDKTGYQSALSAQSRGVLDMFSSLDLDMKGSGRIADGTLVPQSFVWGKSRKDKDKKITVTWQSGRLPVANRSFTMKSDRVQAIADHLSRGMPDPLTALLRKGVLAGQKPCEGKERVFNGAEIYDLGFSFDKADNFSAKDGGVYRGPAVKCLVTYRPVAGVSPEKLKSLQADPPKFNIWFAPVASHSMGTIYVPVAIAGRLNGTGTVFTALASHATLAGQPLNAQSLASQ